MKKIIAVDGDQQVELVAVRTTTITTTITTTEIVVETLDDRGNVVSVTPGGIHTHKHIQEHVHTHKK